MAKLKRTLVVTVKIEDYDHPQNKIVAQRAFDLDGLQQTTMAHGIVRQTAEEMFSAVKRAADDNLKAVTLADLAEKSHG